MATPDIFVRAYNTSSAQFDILRSTNDGSTWSSIISSLGTYASSASSGSLINHNNKIYGTNNDYLFHWNGSTDYKINVRSLLSLASTYRLGPIKVVDETNIYFVAFEIGGSKTIAFYKFNGNWAAPVVGDFALNGSKAAIENPRGIATPDNINFHFGINAVTGGVLVANDPYLIGYPGPSSGLYADATLRITGYTGSTTYGVSTFGATTYVLTSDINRITLYSGSYGSWAQVITWTGVFNLPTGANYNNDSTIWIHPDNGTIYITYVEGSVSKMNYWESGDKTNPANWNTVTFQHVASNSYLLGPPLSGDNSGIVWVANYTDAPYNTSYLYKWNGASFGTPITIAGYSLIGSIAVPYDSPPFLDSGPLTPNNKYFTTQPMVWSIGD